MIGEKFSAKKIGVVSDFDWLKIKSILRELYKDTYKE
jgi:hypothetical protein